MRPPVHPVRDLEARFEKVLWVEGLEEPPAPYSWVAVVVDFFFALGRKKSRPKGSETC